MSATRCGASPRPEAEGSDAADMMPRRGAADIFRRLPAFPDTCKVAGLLLRPEPAPPGPSSPRQGRSPDFRLRGFHGPDMGSRPRGAKRPGLAVLLASSFKKEGAGKAGCALHPRSRVQRVVKKAHTSIQVQRRQSGLPCAMVLRLIARSPWRSGFLVTIAREACSADLTPASRRQDHTTSPSASGAPVLRTLRVHRIQPRVRDVAKRPSSGVDGEGC